MVICVDMRDVPALPLKNTRQAEIVIRDHKNNVF